MEPCTLGTARLANFRLGYTARMAQIANARVKITLRGLDARTRIAGLTIRDVLNDAPNTCNLTIDGVERPACEQALRVVLGRDHPRLLFNGALQTVDTSYEGWPPTQRVYPCTAIDDTARVNRMRPFGSWVNVSATIFAQQLFTQFAPGFTTHGVQAGLPPVTITLDGTEGMSGALKQAATQIGGYFYVDDGDLHLFIEESLATPDPIDGTPGRLLADPPIRITRDDSQLRTRQCGRGHGEALLADVAAGETILPVANVSAWFNAVGSAKRAIALSQRLTYTGVQDAGGGSLVGPGASPVVAPNVTAIAGAGLPNGVLRYAFSFVTAVGESLPGPLALITAGPVTGAPLANPTTAPSGSPAGGAGLTVGTRLYAFSWTNGAGETLVGPTVAITVVPMAAPPAPTWPGNIHSGQLPNGVFPANQWTWAVTFVLASGGDSAMSGRVAWGNSGGTPNTVFLGPTLTIPTGPAGTVARRIWRTRVQPDAASAMNAQLLVEGIVNDNSTTVWNGGNVGDGSLVAMASGDAVTNGVVNLGGIAGGPAGTTGRNVYRSVAGGSALQLLTVIGGNSGTTFQDTTPDGALGAAPPGSNTTAITTNLNAATLAGIAQGPGTVTARKIYRTTANGSQLKLLQTLPNNTATVGANDTAADATLGANAPISDTSGLVGVGVAGAVLPGATQLLTSGAGPFPASGWVFLSGNQLVRYTGIAGNTLTGIPALGVGAIVTTVLYGTQVLPAPALIGVVGVVLPIVKGTPICIWVQRDDAGAQAEQAIVDAANGIVPADGIYEGPPLVDERRNEASLRALCDATLALYARPIVTVVYACRDVKTRSGETIVIDLDDPPIHETLTIQEVTITEIDIAPGTLPRFSVVAASSRFSLDDIVRRLLTATDSVTSA